jgi:hypothetical protein
MFALMPKWQLPIKQAIQQSPSLVARAPAQPGASTSTRSCGKPTQHGATNHGFDRTHYVSVTRHVSRPVKVTLHTLYIRSTQASPYSKQPTTISENIHNDKQMFITTINRTVREGWRQRATCDWQASAPAPRTPVCSSAKEQPVVFPIYL